MMIKTIKYLFLYVLIFAANSFPQHERYTKGAENGYAWQRMEDPAQFYSTSRETYLSSVLQRLRLTGESYPETDSLGCRQEINRLFAEEKSGEILLADVVKEIDKFYSQSDNLVVPIIFAYCYSIKKFAGAGAEELNAYREKVLLFCYE
jgi:hypothetical protein